MLDGGIWSGFNQQGGSDSNEDIDSRETADWTINKCGVLETRRARVGDRVAENGEAGGGAEVGELARGEVVEGVGLVSHHLEAGPEFGRKRERLDARSR